MGHAARPSGTGLADNAYPALKRWATLGKAHRACSLAEVRKTQLPTPPLSNAGVTGSL